jgi:hypothetical protein
MMARRGSGIKSGGFSDWPWKMAIEIVDLPIDNGDFP